MSTFMAGLRTALAGYVRYRGREGHWSFLLHRLTGLGTLLFLIIHILDTSTVYFFPSLYDHAIALYRSTPLMIGEIALVFAVIYHGVNGLRIAWADMVQPELWTIEAERRWARRTLVVAVILWLPAAVWMGRSLLIHNFGLLG